MEKTVMYIRHKLGRRSALRPDEKLLYSQTDFRAISLVCAPLNRGLWLRSFVAMELRITNRRLLLSASFPIPPFYHQEVDLWFPGQEPEGRTDLITAVSCAEGYWGRCLEIRSRDPKRRRTWFSSPELTVRMFCTKPEEIEAMVREAMMPPQ